MDFNLQHELSLQTDPTGDYHTATQDWEDDNIVDDANSRLNGQSPYSLS